MDSKINEILNFWFVEISPKQHFIKDLDFDAMLATRFGDLVSRAINGDLDSWADDRDGVRALIILCDQMTRNIYRDTAKAFSGDAKALAWCLMAIERGDLEMLNDASARQFLLMPMMHSEDLSVQNQSLPLFEKYTPEMTYDYAVKHQVIIERFGHFPHRNEILGRPSSEDEKQFLQMPDSSF